MSLELDAFYNSFDVLFLTHFELCCSIKLYIWSCLHRIIIVPLREGFSYRFLHASLTHNVLCGHAICKHNYPLGMLLYKTGKQTIIGRAT
jgi:hypothetical protein